MALTQAEIDQINAEQAAVRKLNAEMVRSRNRNRPKPRTTYKPSKQWIIIPLLAAVFAAGIMLGVSHTLWIEIIRESLCQ